MPRASRRCRTSSFGLSSWQPDQIGVYLTPQTQTRTDIKLSSYVRLSSLKYDHWQVVFWAPQWISLQYRRLQKIEQIEPDHCDKYQNNRTKIVWHWSATSAMDIYLSSYLAWTSQLHTRCRALWSVLAEIRRNGKQNKQLTLPELSKSAIWRQFDDFYMQFHTVILRYFNIKE